jgi:NAD(P)H-hydrate epimerase
MSQILQNTPELWKKLLPLPTADSHKYTRGTALIRGGRLMTGASRLSARAAQRMGAGLVTLAVPSEALAIYATSLESIIVTRCDDIAAWQALLNDAKAPALLLGPGLGHDRFQRDEILSALASRRPIVLDADALTLCAGNGDGFFDHLHPFCVLTPHEGECARLFPGLKGDKAEQAHAAAARAGCIVLLKGATTFIATPAGDIVVNHNAPPWLATAGSGDVLAGIILGLLAQKMDPLMAASAAAWIHGDCARKFGLGLIAEDIVGEIPGVLQELIAL